MKLSTSDNTNLVNILNTCAIGGIEAVIIEDGKVRGVNESRTCAMVSAYNVPAFPQKLGITRLSALRQRIDLFSDLNGLVIDAKESERGEISSLEMSVGKSKAQFRCTSTMLIKAPKSINDEAVNRIFVTKAEMKLVLNSIKVMGSKKIMLTIKKDGLVSFQASDAANDNFNASFENPVERLTGGSTDSVVHNYSADIFADLMRGRAAELDIIAFDVGAVGTIYATVNGHIMAILPQINEDSGD